MMKSEIVVFFVTLLVTIAAPSRAQFQYGGPARPNEPRVDAGLEDDLIVGEVIRSAASFITSLPSDEMPLREQLRQRDRITLALRAVEQRNIPAVRWDLLALVEVCEGGLWQDMALDTYAAIHAVGESRTYLTGQVVRAADRPYRAAAALWILAGLIEEEAEVILRTSLQSCKGVPNGTAAISQIRDVAFHVTRLRRTKERVQSLLASGENEPAYKILIREALMSQRFQGILGPQSPWAIYSPVSVYARRVLAERIAEDQAGVASALDAMSWRDFTWEFGSVGAPATENALTAESRDHVRVMFPALGS